MSLLNEALRKNKSEKTRKIIFNFPSRETKKSKKKIVIIFIVFIALIIGFIFVWIYHNRYPNKPGVVTPQVLIKDDIPKEVQVPEPVESKPVISQKTDKEIKSDPVLNEQETTDKASIKESEQIGIPSISKIPEVHVTKREAIPKISENEIIKDDEESYYKKAIQFHKQGNLEMAVSMYKKALNYNPENTDTRFNLASVYISMSRYSDAYNILLKLDSCNPSDSNTMLNLAIAEIGLGKDRDALVHLKGIKEEGRELRFKVAFHEGIALSHTGESAEAIIRYKDAESFKPDSPALLLNMAVLYDRLGNYNEAINYYLKLIDSDSSNTHENEKYKKRIETLRSNISKSPVKNAPRDSTRGI